MHLSLTTANARGEKIDLFIKNEQNEKQNKSL